MVRWTLKAREDLGRLHGFLAAVDATAAARVVRGLIAAVGRLAVHPRLGARLSDYPRREVRRLIVGDYEIRYALRGDQLFILRLWHVREDR